MDTPSQQSAQQDQQHIPVMLDEVLRSLRPQDGGIYVDATFGAGGYSRAILDAADCKVYAIDRDPVAIEGAKPLLEKYAGRLHVLHGCFGAMQALLKNAGVERVDGIVMDIGVSSMQLDQAARGFSFRHDGPLDMRMGNTGKTAADVVNTYSEKELADILFLYGEERASRRIAKKIATVRREAPITTTQELKAVIHSVLPMHGGMKTDTATRSFQALRIFVNDELEELSQALAASRILLGPAGRLVVVTFHSLEDGIVKSFLKEESGRLPAASRHLPETAPDAPPVFTLEKSGGLKPGAEEIKRNPRARSARLRYAIRTEHVLPEGAHA